MGSITSGADLIVGRKDWRFARGKGEVPVGAASKRRLSVSPRRAPFRTIDYLLGSREPFAAPNALSASRSPTQPSKCFGANAQIARRIRAASLRISHPYSVDNGLGLTGWKFTLAAAAYNLIRMRKLQAAAA